MKEVKVSLLTLLKTKRLEAEKQRELQKIARKKEKEQKKKAKAKIKTIKVVEVKPDLKEVNRALKLIKRIENELLKYAGKHSVELKPVTDEPTNTNTSQTIKVRKPRSKSLKTTEEIRTETPATDVVIEPTIIENQTTESDVLASNDKKQRKTKAVDTTVIETPEISVVANNEVTPSTENVENTDTIIILPEATITPAVEIIMDVQKTEAAIILPETTVTPVIEIIEDAPKTEAPIVVYCLKCKKNVNMINGEMTTNKSGNPVIIGNCPDCNMKLNRFMKRTVAK